MVSGVKGPFFRAVLPRVNFKRRCGAYGTRAAQEVSRKTMPARDIIRAVPSSGEQTGDNMMIRKFMLVGAMAMIAAGCTTNPYTGERRASRAVTSGAAGAGAGAAAGAVIGAIAGDAGKGAVIGAGVGAATGTGIGIYQDRQQAKLRQELEATGVSVTRVGDNIQLNMPSDITFATASADITPQFYATLNSVAKVLKEFNRTTISIAGHADARGRDDYNLTLSQNRALAVSQYLATQGVDGQRLRAIGFGESRPIADNETAAGQAVNRRVEIIIDPVEEAF